MTNETAIEMFVAGLLLDPATQSPVVVLKDESGEKSLPIWIGIAEATSIASFIKKIEITRPLTHDLMYTTITSLGLDIERVVINDLKDGTYFSEIVLSQGDRAIIIDSRPSDAIALALRAGCGVFVFEKVLSQALKDNQEKNVKKLDSKPTKKEGFRDIDREKWREILEDLNPEDFKYKM